MIEINPAAIPIQGSMVLNTLNDMFISDIHSESDSHAVYQDSGSQSQSHTTQEAAEADGCPDGSQQLPAVAGELGSGSSGASASACTACGDAAMLQWEIGNVFLAEQASLLLLCNIG